MQWDLGLRPNWSGWVGVCHFYWCGHRHVLGLGASLLLCPLCCLSAVGVFQLIPLICFALISPGLAGSSAQPMEQFWAWVSPSQSASPLQCYPWVSPSHGHQIRAGPHCSAVPIPKAKHCLGVLG